MKPLPFDRRALAENGSLRRIRIDLHTPAEKAIRDAAIAVEALGAHVWLTDAVILLGKAQDRVADYVDDRINHGEQPFFRRMAELEAVHDTTVGLPPEIARWYCIECSCVDDSADRMTMHGANTGHQPFYGTKSDRDHHRGVLRGGK